MNVFSIFTPAALALPTPSPEPPAVPEVKGQIEDLEGGYGGKSYRFEDLLNGEGRGWGC